MATIPPQGPQAPAVTADAFEVYASIDVDALVTRLSNEAKRLLVDYSQRGLTGQELANAVQQGLADLSPVPLEKAGRMAGSEAFNLGRNLGIQENLDAIREAVRTEVLDTDTCEPCELLDGIVFDVSSGKILRFPSSASQAFVEGTLGISRDDPLAYYKLLPPNYCDGRELCRGFPIARAA